MTKRRIIVVDSSEQLSSPGPRALRDPRSRDYALQTLAALKWFLESTECDERRVETELNRIRAYRHWEILGFESLHALLQSKLGDAALTQLRRMPIAEKVLTLPKTLTHSEAGRRGGRGKQKAHTNGEGFQRSQNSVENIVRRLKRDHPAIAEDLARGVYRSARAAGIAAGFIKPDDPLKMLKKWWTKATTSTRKQFLVWLEEQEK